MSIVIAGGNKVGKRSIVKAIISHRSSHDSSSCDFKDESHPPSKSEEGIRTSHRWDIQTRYYSAETDVHVCGNDSLPMKQLIGDAEGLILVHDLTRPETFDAVKSWGETVESTDSPPEVLLCIGTHLDTFEAQQSNDGDRNNDNDKGKEKMQSRFKRHECFEWSLDNGFEYIELTLGNDGNNDSQDNDNKVIDDDEGAQGIDRVIEAFHCHMWPNMVMASGVEKPSIDPIEIDDSNVTNNSNNSKITDNSDNSEPKTEPEAKKDEEDKDKNDGDKPPPASAVFPSLLGTDPSEFFGDEGEDLAMAALMEKMVKLKAEGPSMPDSVRKEKAAELALALAALIGEDED